MEKDFDNWNEKKKKTHSETMQIVFYEREVWWAYAGINIGVDRRQV